MAVDASRHALSHRPSSQHVTAPRDFSVQGFRPLLPCEGMSDNTMRIIDLRGKRLTRAEMLAAMPRAEMGKKEATDLVRPILDDVRDRGAAALRDFEE